MPGHNIEITLPTKPLKNADMTISIWSDGKLLGHMRVSQGTIDWQRSGYSPRQISWEDFAEALNKLTGTE